MSGRDPRRAARERARAMAASSGRDVAVETETTTNETDAEPVKRDGRASSRPNSGGEPQTSGNLLRDVSTRPDRALARSLDERTQTDVGPADVSARWTVSRDGVFGGPEPAVTGEITDAGTERQVEQERAQAIQQQVASDTAASPEQVTASVDGGDTDVGLTAAGRKAILRERVEEQGGFETDDGDFVEAGPDQLEFDDDGNVTGVDRGSSGIVGGVVDVVQGAADVVPGSDQVAEGSKEIVDATDEVGGPVVGAGEATVDVASNLPGSDVTTDVVTGVGSRVGSASKGAADVTKAGVDAAVAPLEAGEEVFSGQSASGFNEGEPDQSTEVTNAIRGAGKAAADLTVGLPNALASGAKAGGQAAEFTAERLSDEGLGSGTATAATAATAATVAGASAFEREARENPAETAGALVGGASVGTALSPLRVSTTRVPKAGGGSTTLRGVRAVEPRVLQGRSNQLSTQGRTLVGTQDGRPTTGTPVPDADDVDFSRLGGRGDTGEAVGRFETDVLGGIARQDKQAGKRFDAAERLAATGSRADTELQTSSTEDIVRSTDEVPDEAAPEVSRALQDLDATIFGSASVRAQVPDARKPRDLDIEVADPERAERRLSRALDEADVEAGTEVFDIKARSERPQPGEPVKMGQLARSRLTTDEGVEVTRAGEELVKKAGASAFLRGEGSPAPDQPGRGGGVDVGPEPVAEGSFVRAKDPGDAATIGAEIATSESRLSGVAPRQRTRRERVSEFQDQFETEIGRSLAEPDRVDAPRAPTTAARDRLALDELAGETRAQAGGGALRRRDSDSSDSSTFGQAARPSRDRDRDTDRQGSRGGTAGFSPTVPAPFGSSSGGRTDRGESQATSPGELSSGSTTGVGRVFESPDSDLSDAFTTSTGGGGNGTDSPAVTTSPGEQTAPGGTVDTSSTTFSTQTTGSLGSTPTRVRLFGGDDDSERGDELRDRLGAESPFENPVKTTSEVLSDDSNPGGSASRLGLSDRDIDDLEGRL